MTHVGRPSLDVLIPLVMIDDDSTDGCDENVSCQSQKEIFRYFESGDLVLVRVDHHCSPAIVFNSSGLVMKFDIDRQLYHVCLLDRQLTEKWVDANDMITFPVPMIADCDNEETMLMWSTANELLSISNNDSTKTRLNEFQRRFNERKKLHNSNSQNSTSTDPNGEISLKPKAKSSKNISYTLTTCEEHAIIESIHRSSPVSFAETTRIAEETYQRILFTNTRENVPLSEIKIFPENWFVEFLTRYVDHFQLYLSSWLLELEAMVFRKEANDEMSSLISIIKKSIY